MRKIKRGLALLLTTMMLITALPVTAMAEGLEDDPKAWDGLAYCIGTEQTDEMAAIGWPGYAEEDFTFEEDGSYTIRLPKGESSVFFIYFDEELEPVEEVVDFSETNPAEVNGHTIYAELDSEDAPTLGSTVEELTLFPVPEEYSDKDLRGKFPEELKEIKVADLLPSGAIPAGREIAYGITGDDSYEIKDISEATVDFSDYWEYQPMGYYTDPETGTTIYENWTWAELIVLSTADSTSKDTVRYIVSVKLPTMYGLLDMDVKDSAGKTVWETYQNSYRPGWYPEPSYFTLARRQSDWKPEDGALLRMKFSSQFGSTSSVTATVYEGSYETRAEIEKADAKDVTSEVWGSSASGYLLDMEEYRANPEFTLIVTRGGEDVLVKPFRVSVTAIRDQINVRPSALYESSVHNSEGRLSLQLDRETGIYSAMVNKGKSTSDEYYCVMYANSWKDGQSIGDYTQIVDVAYVGDYATKEAAEAAGAEDIKDALFGDGYKANYGKGVKFTVFTLATDTVESERYFYTVQTRPYVAPFYEAEDRDYRSLDTYFYVTNAEEAGYEAYYMSGADDSYYENGYQTVFVLDNGGPVKAEKIHPTFVTGTGVTAYAEHNQNGKSGVKQESGKTEHDFTPGESIHYSAASERKTHLRNYWVTFVTQTTDGPDLFINGITNIDYDHTEDGLPVREVLLGAGSSSYHDIFVANIGNEKMTNLKVELTGARNVKLDEYWDFGETRELDAFTTTERRMENGQIATYGELYNVTKIRLLRDGNGTGEIAGTLTISADGIDPVTIKLSGKAGLPKITTTALEDAVKWVPYSHLIQTSNMYGASGITFTATRPLPAGLTLEPDGEIYGAPLVYGTFTIGVQIAYNGQVCDTKEYTLEIKDNTDYNVWNASDYSYEILEDGTIGERNPDSNVDINNPDAAETFILQAGELKEYELHSAGPYFYFTKVWLDGEELSPDQYTTDEGSTRVVIIDQTVNGNRVNGTHTIAAEFRERENANDKGTLRRTSQNYTIEGGIDKPAPTPSKPSGGGSSRPSKDDDDRPSKGGGSTSKPSTPTTPSRPNIPVETPVSALPFGDVNPNNWFYNDVLWAWEQELMNGVSADRFAPEDNVSQATIVTILARMRNIDLTQYSGETSETVEAGKYFTESAIWAQRAGMLPDNSTFTGEEALSREGMAIMLVNYMTSMGVDTTGEGSDLSFSDVGEMSEAGRQAFQVLCQYGIFNGMGDGRMNPNGSTTRAQFAALIHRISSFTENR